MVDTRKHGTGLAAGCAVALVLVTATAAWTGFWVLTAIPVGFLFGFALEKGDLCGASAMSEVLVFRDRTKLFGLWVAVAGSMVVFALLDAAGLAKAAPKPLLWLSMSLGGLVFGVGTVLAGGCVSGCLYKAGTGNLNSMAALVGMPAGVALLEAGPLRGLDKVLNAAVVKNADGSPVTFASLLGVPFLAVALAVAAITIGAVVSLHRRARGAGKEVRSWPGFGLRRSWRPWQAGLAVALIGGLGWLSSAASGRNYPLGVTHGPYNLAALAFWTDPVHVVRKPVAPIAKPAAAPAPAGAAVSAPAAPDPAAKAPAAPPRPKVVWWLVALVTSLVAGSFVSARLGGRAKLLPRPPGETIVAFLGGLLVGLGAGAAKGCVIGNIISGVGLLSVGTAIFAVTTFFGNQAATWFYLMGGGLRSRR